MHATALPVVIAGVLLIGVPTLFAAPWSRSSEAVITLQLASPGPAPTGLQLVRAPENRSVPAPPPATAGAWEIRNHPDAARRGQG